ncbi:Flp family type IVb pilin [Spirillospora albida]|uniref:Flp family type IVb pilin n=1 Tax=Spirillospora albida TaxID=58123 RepID=UPI0004C06C67|nr:Flp family type IVb pilin [Spirillospora albida]
MLLLYTHLQTLLAARHAAVAEDRERGATAVEYGLMVALIAAVIVGTVILLGQGLDVKFNEVLDRIG